MTQTLPKVCEPSGGLKASSSAFISFNNHKGIRRASDARLSAFVVGEMKLINGFQNEAVVWQFYMSYAVTQICHSEPLFGEESLNASVEISRFARNDIPDAKLAGADSVW